ncbi:MAG TPA: aminotransferase class V-fold PLP-dependent enzyme, partial [Pseudomonadota bacterium]|nr:aminotransferase class V-fold PLP-dependent enzyme [Pseudomonadota bacterium]
MTAPKHKQQQECTKHRFQDRMIRLIGAAEPSPQTAFDVEKSKCDLVSLSAHKMYGPKGVGALWVRRKPRVRIAPLIDGGGHERGMR